MIKRVTPLPSFTGKLIPANNDIEGALKTLQGIHPPARYVADIIEPLNGLKKYVETELPEDDIVEFGVKDQYWPNGTRFCTDLILNYIPGNKSREEGLDNKNINSAIGRTGFSDSTGLKEIVTAKEAILKLTDEFRKYINPSKEPQELDEFKNIFNTKK
ncbi:MAG: hypothetical protein A2287_03125 [Candidatus Melainabacteria bacterium RIFOXYA12_FULL_32_12]|nr:MAG: hypothetical protein A2255_05240 [Candidatus Melainabacteria bacterium RIFOXYA2_FULL_32_9]OGI24801.1 MAG: hypothetical protein A2287_03125 [Candidatus Melainabacteria bacterium RIFOXYA12_FULL_32_12]